MNLTVLKISFYKELDINFIFNILNHQTQLKEKNNLKKLKFTHINMKTSNSVSDINYPIYDFLSSNRIISLNLSECTFDSTTYTFFLNGLKICTSLRDLKLNCISFKENEFIHSQPDVFYIFENIKNMTQYVKISV